MHRLVIHPRFFSTFIGPEILRNEAYSYAVDWWSLGVVAYVLLFGYYPYSHGIAKLQFNRSPEDRHIMLQRIERDLVYFPPAGAADCEQAIRSVRGRFGVGFLIFALFIIFPSFPTHLPPSPSAPTQLLQMSRLDRVTCRSALLQLPWFSSLNLGNDLPPNDDTEYSDIDSADVRRWILICYGNF